MSMNDDFTDDQIDALFANMTDSLTDVAEPTNVTDVTELSPTELVRGLAKVREDLYAIGEMQAENPTTAEARELHSQRMALLLELRRRQLL